jgi:hypothetical protein
VTSEPDLSGTFDTCSRISNTCAWRYDLCEQALPFLTLVSAAPVFYLVFYALVAFFAHCRSMFFFFGWVSLCDKSNIRRLSQSARTSFFPPLVHGHRLCRKYIEPTLLLELTERARAFGE